MMSDSGKVAWFGVALVLVLVPWRWPWLNGLGFAMTAVGWLWLGAAWFDRRAKERSR